MSHSGTWLHRIGNQALVNDAILNHDFGFLESGFHIAPRDLPAEINIVRDATIQQRGALLGGFDRIDNRWKRLILHLDHVGGIARLIAVFGDDSRNCITNIAHLIGSQGRMWRGLTL